MARRNGEGPLIGITGADAGNFNFGNGAPPLPRNSPDGQSLGFAGSLMNNITQLMRFGYDAIGADTETDMFGRFWFRVRRYPQKVPSSAELPTRLGHVSIFGTQNSIQGGPGTVMYLTDGGQIIWRNTGNLLDTQYYTMLTTPQLALNAWYRIDWYQLQAVGAGRVQLRLWTQSAAHSWQAGSMIYNSGLVGDPVPTHSGEGINSTGLVVDYTIGRKANTNNTGGIYDYSNITCDDAVFPEDSHWTAVPVVGPGTYQMWTGGNLAWQARNIRSTAAQTQMMSTNVQGLNNRQSYLLKSLRSMGITGTIYQYRLSIFRETGTGGLRYFLRINGVDHDTITDAMGNIYKSVLIDSTDAVPNPPPLHPDDVIEIGVTGTDTAAVQGVAGMHLLVEHDSPLSRVADFGLGADVEIVQISWTGTGANTGQTVTLPFIPNFLLAWPRPLPSVVQSAGMIWWDTMRMAHLKNSEGPFRDNLRVLIDPTTGIATLNIAGGDAQNNELNTPYDCLLIRDPTNRILSRGWAHFNTGVAQIFDPDNQHIVIGELTATPGPLSTVGAGNAVLAIPADPDDTTWEGVTRVLGPFGPDALLLYAESSVGTSHTQYFRGPAETGDRSIPWGNTGPQTDIIQRLFSDGFELGTSSWQSNASSLPFVAVRLNDGSSQSIVALSTWKGNGDDAVGNNSYGWRVIPLALGGRTPSWVIVWNDRTADAKQVKFGTMRGTSKSFYSQTNQDSVVALDGSPTETAQSWTNTLGTGGGRFKTASFYLRKVGSPTGSIVAKLYDTAAQTPVGTAIGVSDPIDVSTLTTGFQWINFQFTSAGLYGNQARLLPGQIYAIAVAYTGTVTDYVEVGNDAVGGAAGIRSDFTGAWANVAGQDLIHEAVSEGGAGWTSGTVIQNGVMGVIADGIIVDDAQNVGVIQSSYDQTNLVAATPEQLDGSPTETAQTFTSLAAGGVLSSAKFLLRKVGAPIGSMVAKLYATAAGVPTGAALATSDAISASVLGVNNGQTGSGYANVFFQFTGVNRITLAGTTVYAIAIAYTGTATDLVDVGQDSTAPTHAGAKYNFTGVWTLDTEDLCFYVFTDGNNYTVLAFAEGIDGAGVLPSGTWHEFLVAGHALKSIDSWYVGGVRQPTSSAQGDPETEAYFLIPGYSAWGYAFGSTVKTHTVNGHVYTVIFIKEGGNSPLDTASIISGQTPLTINVKGVETVGDGSGTLIENSLDIYYHFLKNWLFGDYQSGAWLPVDTFPDTEAVPIIDAQSFTDCQAISVRRVDTGYLGAGGFGLDGNFVSLRDAVRVMNISCDVDSGLNRKCQFFVSMTDDSAASLQQSPMLTDVNDVKDGSFSIDDDFSAHFNVIPYSFAHDYTINAKPAWRSTGEAISQESIDGYLDTLTMPDFELWFVRDSVIAADIAHRKLIRHKDPPRLVRLSVPAKGFNIELGDVRRIQHYAGIGATGWSGQPVRMQRHISDLNQDSVSFESYDMSRLFETIFILGNEIVLNPLWATAPALDRIYGYLADESTKKFSDGQPGKRVR